MEGRLPCALSGLPGSLLFSVVSPHDVGIVKFPVKKSAQKNALWLCRHSGPVFHGGLTIRFGSVGTLGYRACACDIGEGYEDVIGKGTASLTGTKHFAISELEVFSLYTPSKQEGEVQ